MPTAGPREGRAMVITAVDEGLEKLLRTAVPLPADLADISFEPPDGQWGAQLSRITLNLFLFDIARSPLPPHPPSSRARDDGRVETRPALPLVRISYLVSAWSGNTRDEHQVLGEALSCFLSHDVLPPEMLPTTLPASAQLSVGAREGRKPGELWSALQGKLKPAFELEVTVALDAKWRLAPTVVSRVEGQVGRRPAPAPDTDPLRRPTNGEPPQVIRRRSGTAVVAERPPATDS